MGIMVKRKRSIDKFKLPYLDKYLKSVNKELKKYNKILGINKDQVGGAAGAAVEMVTISSNKASVPLIISKEIVEKYKYLEYYTYEDLEKEILNYSKKYSNILALTIPEGILNKYNEISNGLFKDPYSENANEDEPNEDEPNEDEPNEDEPNEDEP